MLCTLSLCFQLPCSPGGVTASFCVSPLLATLLLAFKDRQHMAAAELAAAVRKTGVGGLGRGVVASYVARVSVPLANSGPECQPATRHALLPAPHLMLQGGVPTATTLPY